MKFVLFFVNIGMFLEHGRPENVPDDEMTANLKDPFTDGDSTKITAPKILTQVTNLNSRYIAGPTKFSSPIRGSGLYTPLQPYSQVISETIPFQAIDPPSMYSAHIFSPPLSVSGESQQRPIPTGNEALLSEKSEEEILNVTPTLFTAVVPFSTEKQRESALLLDAEKELEPETELVLENENKAETQTESDSDWSRRKESLVIDEVGLLQKPHQDENIANPSQNSRDESQHSFSGETFQGGDFESKIEKGNLPTVENVNKRDQEEERDFFKDDEFLPQEADPSQYNRANQETGENNEPGDDHLQFGLGQKISLPETESGQDASSPESDPIQEPIPEMQGSSEGVEKESVQGTIPLLNEVDFRLDPPKKELFEEPIFTRNQPPLDANVPEKDAARQIIPVFNKFNQGMSFPQIELAGSLVNKSNQDSVSSGSVSTQGSEQQENEELPKKIRLGSSDAQQEPRHREENGNQSKQNLRKGNGQWKHILSLPASEPTELTDKVTTTANTDGLRTEPEIGKRNILGPRVQMEEPEIKGRVTEKQETEIFGNKRVETNEAGIIKRKNGRVEMRERTWKPEGQKPGIGRLSTAAIIPEMEKADKEKPSQPEIETLGIRTAEVGIPAIGSLEIRKPEVGLSEMGTLELKKPEEGIPEMATPEVRKPELGTPEIEEPDEIIPKFWPIPTIMSGNISESDDENDVTRDEGFSAEEPTTKTDSPKSILKKESIVETDTIEAENDPDEIEDDEAVIDEKKNVPQENSSANNIDNETTKADLSEPGSVLEETTTERKKTKTRSRYRIPGNFTEAPPEIVDIQQLPFLAISVTRLNHEKHIRCTAAIISEWYILSAAHCYYDRGEVVIPSRVTIVTAQTHSDINEKGPHTQLRVGEDVSIYPGYGPLLFDSIIKDLAVVKVRKAFEFNEYCKSISIRTTPVSATEALSCHAPGWAITGSKNQLFAPNQLAKMNLTVGLGTACPCLHWLETKGLMCSVWRSTYSICKEDMGGPLICGGKLVAVAQGLLSPNCSQPIRLNDEDCGGDKLSVYVYLCPYLGWLSGYVRELRELDDFPCADPDSAPLRTAHFIATITLLFLVLNLK